MNTIKNVSGLTDKATGEQVKALRLHCKRAKREFKEVVKECWFDGLLDVLFVPWPAAGMVLGIELDGHCHS